MRGVYVLMIGSLVAAWPVTAHSQTPGLLAAYAMTTGADSSGNNRPLTLTNTQSVVGRYGTAQRFNGQNSRATAPTVPFTTAFTLSAWVSLAPSASVRAAVPGVAVGPRATNGWEEIIYKGTDNVFLATAAGVLTGGFTTGGKVPQVIAPSALVDAEWTYCAVTYDGAKLTLYQNGKQVAQAAATGPIALSTDPLEVGGIAGTGGVVNGRIDDVRIYNRALTPNEINVDMSTPIDAGKEPVVRWDLESWQAGTDPSGGGSPVNRYSALKSEAACNLPPLPLPPPTTAIANPTVVRVEDPELPGRVCEIAATPFFQAIPLGKGYTATITAKGATAGSARSPVSNPFDIIADTVPPTTPGGVRVLDK